MNNHFESSNFLPRNVPINRITRISYRRYIYISKLRRELENEIRDWPANDGQFARWKKVLSKDGKGKNPI